MRHVPLQFSLIWQSYLLFWICGTLAIAWPLPAFFSAAILLFIDKRLWQLPRIALVLFLFFAAFLYANTQFNTANNLEKHTPQWYLNWNKDHGPEICGRIVRVQGMVGERLRIFLKNVKPVDSPDALPGLCAWTWEKPPTDITPLPDQTACINRPIKKARSFVNDTEREINSTLISQEAYWRIWSKGESGEPRISGDAPNLTLIRALAKQKFINALTLAQPADWAASFTQPKAMLLALLFGDKYYLSNQTVDNFASATLAHSLALSGQHLIVAGLIAVLIIGILGKLKPHIYLSIPKKILLALTSVPPALLYLWIGNAPPSLIRAACMLAILTFWLWRGRNFSGTDILSSALLVILLYNPLAIFDIGLQLSILCIAVLTITGPVFNRLLPRPNSNAHFKNKLFFYILQILTVSLLIQVALLPLTLTRFYTAGWWFPLNIIWLPLLGAITLPLGVLGLFICLIPISNMDIIAHYILEIAALPCKAILWLLDTLQGLGILQEPAFLLPYWTNLLAFAILLVCICWLTSSRLNKRLPSGIGKMLYAIPILLAIGPLMRLSTAFDNDIHIETLDVGQGQAILIKYPGNGLILIDGGGSPGFDIGKNVVGPTISSNRRPFLNAVINSHPDMDHLGGLFYILENFKVQKIFHNGKRAQKFNANRWLKSQNEHFTRTLRAGDKIILGPKKAELKLEVLHPPRHESRTWLGNDASLVLRLTHKGKGLAIFPGDAGIEALKNILNNNPDIQSAIVFAPHHGSDLNFDESFYRAAKPSLTLISCGYKNNWHMPGPILTGWLNDHKIPYLVTAYHGKISVSFNKDREKKVKTSLKLAEVR